MKQLETWLCSAFIAGTAIAAIWFPITLAASGLALANLIHIRMNNIRDDRLEKAEKQLLSDTAEQVKSLTNRISGLEAFLKTRGVKLG